MDPSTLKMKITKPQKMDEDDDDEDDTEDEEEEKEELGGGDGVAYNLIKKTKVCAGEKGSSGGGGGGAAVAVSGGCQVEKCEADLSDAKKYHKRHKVCEVHAKAPVVIVSGFRQRFCQQCSRFHAVSEFDDAKRSCRRRLACHNERRRKSSTEAGSSRRGSNSQCTQVADDDDEDDETGRSQSRTPYPSGGGSTLNNFHIR